MILKVLKGWKIFWKILESCATKLENVLKSSTKLFKNKVSEASRNF
jgi:hypothetical protein